MTQVERGRRLRELHATDGVFLMPNAWDAGSAMMLASLGFEAVATTSAGVCFSLGVRRVTIGGSLARAVFGMIRRAATEMAEHGSFSFAEQQIPHGELSRFFASRRES